MIALIIIIIIIRRRIQKRIRDKENEVKKDLYWNVGMSSDRIQDALTKWKVDRLPGDLYL